jgi:glycosyltransferase involved in cell wall biosynthesis
MTSNQLNVQNEYSLNITHPSISQNFPKPKVHIIIPAYNEEKAIANVLERTINVFNGNSNYILTVIDDGSKDKTPEIIRSQFPRIDLKKNLQNRGKGYTLRRGISLIQPDEIVVLMDADGEHPPEDINHLIQPILQNKADVVIGSRFLKDKNNTNDRGSYLKNGKKLSQIRKLGNFCFSVLTLLFHRIFITDTQCGFRAYAPGVLSKIPIHSDGFQIETEFTIKCIQKGFRITEVRIDNGA